EFFFEELRKRKFPVGSMIVNRVWPVLPEAAASGASDSLQSVIGWYQEVSRSHQRISEDLRADFGKKIPRLVEVPELASDIDGLAALHQMAQRLDLSEPRP